MPLELTDSNQQLVRAPQPAGYVEAPSRYAREYLEDASPGGLLEYWNILRRRKGAVLLFAFLGIVLALLLTLPQTPVYQGRASLEIQSLNQDFMNTKQVNPISDVPDYNSNDIQTHIKLLQSETLLARVSAKLAQSRPGDPAPPPSRILAWRHAFNLPEPEPVDARKQALVLAASSLKLRAAGQTRVVEILCDSTDPRLAAAFANALGNEYIDQSMEARWQMNQRTSEWLTRQLEDVRIKLERSEDQLQRYARQSGLLFTGDKEKQNVSDEKLRQLQQELSKAQADRISMQSRYEMAQGAEPESLPDVLNDNSLRDYQSKLTDLRRQEADLSATYRPEYAKVKKVNAQIVALETALVRERKAIIDRIRNDYEQAKRREKLLAVSYATQATLVTAESEKSIQYNILKREVDTTRSLYEGMFQRVKESAIASAMRASNVRIVDMATVPKFPYKPSLPLNGMLGLLAGLFLGVAFVVMRERADRTIQAPGDAQFYLNLPELGVIPEANSQTRKIIYRPNGKVRQASPPVPQASTSLIQNSEVGQALSPAGPSPSEPSPQSEPRPSGSGVLPGLPVPPSPFLNRIELITHQRKRCIAAESFRVVLASILFSGENGSRPRVLVLTSASPCEGKTTVTSNLAIALAEIHRKVLLIDADMRKPRMHDIFQVPNTRGLSTVLQQRTLSEESLQGVVCETAIPNLFVLPTGPTAASSLLYSQVLPEMLKRFKKEYDMVLIDTPPMLQMPDARVVGRQADAVVIVVRAGQTTRDAALAVRERLAEDGTRVLGTILNDWNPKQSPNGYYGSSNGYGYYRGYSKNSYAADQG
jgi:capsular exopolysaccharide synthesis family protein